MKHELGQVPKDVMLRDSTLKAVHTLELAARWPAPLETVEGAALKKHTSTQAFVPVNWRRIQRNPRVGT